MECCTRARADPLQCLSNQIGQAAHDGRVGSVTFRIVKLGNLGLQDSHMLARLARATKLIGTLVAKRPRTSRHGGSDEKTRTAR
jgi:hypothetical protein